MSEPAKTDRQLAEALDKAFARLENTIRSTRSLAWTPWAVSCGSTLPGCTARRDTPRWWSWPTPRRSRRSWAT